MVIILAEQLPLTLWIEEILGCQEFKDLENKFSFSADVD
jgi:hypothetical protein